MQQFVRSCLSALCGESKHPESSFNYEQICALNKKEKKLLQQHWHTMIQLNPDVIKDCWIKTSKRSSSIKKAFGMLEDEEPETNASFMNLPITIQAFFKELIFELDCDSVKIRQRCEQLGARHVDFSERGFHSNFWDIFQVCTIEVIAECNLGLNEDQHRSYELAWIHLLSSVVKSMRNGYTRRRTHLERPKSNT